MRLSVLACFYSRMDRTVVVVFVLDKTKNYMGMMFYEEV